MSAALHQTMKPRDLNLMWKWGDIQQSSQGRDYLDRTVGEDKGALLRRSPVNRAGELAAPLLLVHGVKDRRVSYEHAKAMTEALEKAGKRYTGYFPKNETHGIYGDENREAYYERVLDFLDAHIGRKTGRP